MRFFVTCGDATEGGFEPSEEPLDLVALLVKLSVKFGGQLAVCLRWDHVDCALFPDHASDPVGVICLVGQHVLARLQFVQEELAGRRVMGLSGRQFKPERQAVLICKRMNFRSYSAPRTT